MKDLGKREKKKEKEMNNVRSFGENCQDKERMIIISVMKRSNKVER